METTPAIVAYAPLIAAVVIGLGIIVTLAIVAGKIIFHLGGLFTEARKLSESVDGLRTDMTTGFQQLREEMGQLRAESRTEMGQLRAEVKTDIGQLREEMGQLRADIVAGNRELRDEIQRSTDRILQVVQNHRHNDTDGSVTFIVPPGSD